MDQSGTKSTTWNEEEWTAPADEGGISVAAMADAPALTAAAIVGVTLAVLLAIAAVFLLGVLMDWRQQKLLEKKMGEVRRSRGGRRVAGAAGGDRLGIAEQMEEPELTVPPAEALRDIP